jgi:allophanate hydrolase
VDAQTIGGYPKIATVISADLPRIGRLRPGDAVRFSAVTLAQARAAWLAAEAALAATVAAIRPVGEAPDAAALLGADLSGGAVDAARPHHFPHALPED